MAVSPQLVDLNGDGFEDLITTSFNGFVYLSYGNENKVFSNPEILKDKKGFKIHLGRYYDYDKDDWMSTQTRLRIEGKLSMHENILLGKLGLDHCKITKMVDWDHDGDLDMIMSGSYAFLFENTGNKMKPEFTSGRKILDAAVNDIVDWDGDGLWDLIAVSYKSGITFYRNNGEFGNPIFEEGKTLFSAAQFNNGIAGVKSGSFRVSSCDINNDGKLDLLIGSNTSIPRPAPKMTRKLIKEKEQLEKRQEVVKSEYAKLRKKYKNLYSDPDEYRANIRKDPLNDKLYSEKGRLFSKLRMFKAGTTSHGYVWVSLRK